MKQWEKEFDEKFKMSLIPLIPMIPNKRVDLDIKHFISQQIKQAYDKGYRDCDNEGYINKELTEAEEAHRSEEGYCCACGHDMTVMRDKIKQAKMKERKRTIRRIKTMGYRLNTVDFSFPVSFLQQIESEVE